MCAQKFEASLLGEEKKLIDCVQLGNDILRRAHPDAIATMKHWINILKVCDNTKIYESLYLIRMFHDILLRLTVVYRGMLV